MANSVSRALAVKKAVNPIDRHVGSRVRMRRILLGMSQEKLGEALELTFQQVHKYETGMNRISASRLQKISTALNAPPAFFFDGVPVADTTSSSESVASDAAGPSNSTYVLDFISTSEGRHLNKAFARIQAPKIRSSIIDLVVSLAVEQDLNRPLR
jgi:transcriptional regulator with XRE-family HTH domain